MDFILLDLTRRYFHIPFSIWRVLSASSFGGGLSIAVFFLGLNAFWELLFVLIGMTGIVRLAFGKRKIMKLLKLTMILVVLSMLAGGVCNLLYYRMEMSIGALISSGILTYLLLSVFLWWMGREKQEEPLFYHVVLTFMEERVCVEGLMDTGNRLVTPIGQKPVIVVEKAAVDGWLEKAVEAGRGILTIPFYSLGNTDGILLGITIDRMELENSQGRSFVTSPVLGLYEHVLSREGRYRLLLHPKMRMKTGG